MNGSPQVEQKQKASASEWRVMGASCRGASHEAADQPCQDSHQWAICEGWLLAAVADGAGSAAQSEVGAALAVATAIEQLQQALSRDAGLNLSDLEQAMAAARQKIEETAKEREISPREMACTLILAAARDQQVFALQVGDGACVIFPQGDEAPLALVRPQVDGPINETTFLTCESWQKSLQQAEWTGKMLGLSLFTDGLQMLALSLPEWKPFAPFFQPFLRFVGSATDSAAASAQLQTLLASPRFRERSDDDLTLVIATTSGS